MSERGPYDFPPTKPKSEGDQESVTQPEHQPGADLATTDQGAGVELPSLYPKSAKSAPLSPLKLSSPNVTCSSSVPAFVLTSSRSDPQLLMTEQLELSGQNQSLPSHQPQLQTNQVKRRTQRQHCSIQIESSAPDADADPVPLIVPVGQPMKVNTYGAFAIIALSCLFIFGSMEYFKALPSTNLWWVGLVAYFVLLLGVGYLLMKYCGRQNIPKSRRRQFNLKRGIERVDFV